MPLNYLEDDEDLLPPIDEEDQPFVGPRRPFDRNTLAKSTPPPPSLPNAPDVGGDVPPEMRRIIGVNAPMDKLPASDAPVVRSREDAENAYAKAVGAAPSQPKPKWWQRLAAGAVGAAAGYTNAAGRTRPIDATAAERGILAPGYDRKVAEWKQGVTSADATRNAAKANEEAWWKNRQLNTAEEGEEARSARDRAQATYFEDTRAGQLKERQLNDQARIAQAKDAAFVKGREVDAMLIDPAKDPAPQGYLTQPSAASPGMVLAVPPRMMPLTPDLAPYAPGYAVGQQIPWSRFKAAQDAAAKDTLQQNKPVKPPTDNVDRILLNPGEYTPEQVKQARSMFSQIHRPPVTNFMNSDAGKDAVEQVAQSLARGDLSRLRDIASMRGDQRLQIFARAQQINPKFNTAELDRKIKMEDYYTNGKGANNLQSFGTFLEHGGEAADAARAIGQGNPKLINKPINWWRINMSGDPQFQAFATALEPVRKEFEGFLLGGRALYGDDRKQAEIILNENSSLGQLTAALKAMGHTATARMNEENYRYKKAMGHDLVDPVSPEAIDGARKMGVPIGGTRQQAPAAGATNQPVAAAVAAGNPNPNGYVVGHVYRGLTYLGGDPNQQSSWKK